MSKSARINNDEREQIIDSLIAGTDFTSKENDIKEKLYKFAFKLRDIQLGKHKDVYLALPEKLKNTEYRIALSDITGTADGSNYMYLYFNGANHSSEVCPYAPMGFYDLPKAVKEEYVKLADEMFHVDKDLKAFREELTTIMFSISTTNQLKELLPEAIKVLPLTVVAKMELSNLPAVPQSQLDSLRSKINKTSLVTPTK